MFGQRTFFSIIKFVFGEKDEFYIFYYITIFKDRVLFKKTWSSIAIDASVVKKTFLFKFRSEVCKIKSKKES